MLKLKSNFHAFLELIELFRTRGGLIYELTRREIRERYSGRVFGTLWAIGHPLALTLVYIFIFAFVFKTRVGGSLDMPLDYTSYMLAGLIPWLTFQESMGKASTDITANAHIVKQVIFPLEVLPVKGVLATLVSEIVFIILLAIYTLAIHGALLWTYFLLPVLIFLQILAMIGVSYLLSSIGAFFRDLKDVVQVFLSVAFFVLPILYLPEAVPTTVRYILYLNPFSYMVWVFQDVLYFGRFAHPWAWLGFGLLSLVTFVAGYRVFKKLQIMFGDVL